MPPVILRPMEKLILFGRFMLFSVGVLYICAAIKLWDWFGSED